MPDKVQFYNPHTAKFEDSPPPGVDASAAAAMHEAIAKGGKLPSDRTAAELAGLEPGRGGVPVVTRAEPAPAAKP